MPIVYTRQCCKCGAMWNHEFHEEGKCASMNCKSTLVKHIYFVDRIFDKDERQTNREPR